MKLEVHKGEKVSEPVFWENSRFPQIGQKGPKMAQNGPKMDIFNFFSETAH